MPSTCWGDIRRGPGCRSCLTCLPASPPGHTSLPEALFPAGQGKCEDLASGLTGKMYGKCLVNDKGLHEYLFAAGTLSLFNISVPTQQYTERTIRPVMLSDTTSSCGTQPEEQNNRRERNKAEISIIVLFVIAKPQTRHDCLTRGGLSGQA